MALGLAHDSFRGWRLLVGRELSPSRTEDGASITAVNEMKAFPFGTHLERVATAGHGVAALRIRQKHKEIRR